ncbi:MAG: 1-acyl-sn-glycerol-3-phosphate acyltransferase [Chitinophagales bacterium]|nr:1-acyl-sn-glycerol-3-phosphate acyltransferase [Chitinophagales bacterium]
MLKNILGRILAIWAILSFITSFLIIFIPSMLTWLIPDPKGQDWFIRISRWWMTVWLYMVGCRFRIRGEENFKKGETYIVTCNHNSLLDVPLSSPFIPGPNKTIAKDSFKKVPIFGFFYMKGAVLVNRKSDRSRKESYDKMKQVLKQQMHMCIYPEGTRNRTTEPLKKFHDGAFRLAVDTGTSIMPAVIFNTKKASPAHKTFYFWPTRIGMDFLPPVSTAGKTTEALREEVFAIMKAHYEAGMC